MSPGAKIFLTLAGVGATLGVLALVATKKAKASPATPQPSTGPVDVVVPPTDEIPGPAPVPSLPPMVPAPVPVIPAVPAPGTSPPPFVPPFPQFTPQPAPGPAPAPLPVPVPVPDVLSPAPAPLPPPPATVPLPPIVTTPPATPAPLPVPLPVPVPVPPIAAVPPGPVPVPPIPVAVPVPTPAPVPVPVAAPPVTTVSKETAAMVQALLTAEASKGWNVKSAQVEAWQRSRGLVVDGMYGPKSALTVAAELGTVPIVRFWPKGSLKDKAVRDYQAALFTLANTAEPARADQLRFSANREKGQSFGQKTGAAPPIAPDLQVSLAKVA